MSALRHVLIAYETEHAARTRLAAHGYAPDVAAEIAVYLAQSTDLPAFMDEIRDALDMAGIEVSFVKLDDLPALLAAPPKPPPELLLWNMTDGIRFYRGSSVPALARLAGVPRYGSPATAQHLCQDKFLSLAAANAAGLSCPSTTLLQGSASLARICALAPETPLFVKPNTLGAKIGIFADSRCASFDAARALSVRLWERYRDRALVQEFIDGDDVRVSFMDTGGGLREQLGIFRLEKNPHSETGGDFMTMKDNETLSGARDTEGARGGFGAARAAAFTPSMTDLRRDPAPTDTVAAIEDAAARLAGLLGLADCFSMDFRLDARDGKPKFLEFEVCPAVTIYDFQAYLRDTHGLTLGAALARSFLLAHGRQGGQGDA
jgi:D-alanine-D-alanine ligase-like ATP-grasp enzyme